MNARNQSVDKTFLSIDTAEERGFIHRDYIAHCLRWTHFIKRITEHKNYANAHVLDVGCGKECPLAFTLYSSKLMVHRYTGIDAGPISSVKMGKINGSKFRSKFWECTDLLQMEPADFEYPPNWMTCFEVLEHVEPAHCVDMLRHMLKLTSPDCRYFISTPCWDRVNCAGNHVNEITYEVLGAVLEAVGFAVKRVYGTFASIRDYQHELVAQGYGGLFEQLRDYYDSNFLSIVFAPLFPSASRNCLWELARKDPSTYVNKYPSLRNCTQPWSSSSKWDEFRMALEPDSNIS